MSRLRSSRILGACLAASTFCVPVQASYAQASSPPLIYLNQGAAWSNNDREDFYSQDQGSQMIPLAWLKALTTPDGKPFLHDQLQRYGYLPNPFGTDPDLPIGFTASGPQGSETAGMNCAACHTRNISVEGVPYRVDGGPALSDFQGFLTDMVDAVGAVIASDAAFSPFAAKVLGPGATASDVAALRASVSLWYQRENALKQGAYPTPGLWGLGRLDAVSMIFNRLTGLDIGPPPTYLIPGNIQLANAPVRYPFLWNAAIQDKTQWPGFADNGNDLLGLARNLGEVYGVFATFHPVKAKWHLGGLDFLKDNSANFDGLGKLEDLIQQIGAPQYPWQTNPALVAQGEQVWKKPSTGGQSCADCHDEKPGAFRSLSHGTWKTPIQNVGTDTHEWSILGRTANSGVLTGGQFLFLGTPIKSTDTAFGLLGFSVVGSILQKANPFDASAAAQLGAAPKTATLPAKLKELKGAFARQGTAQPITPGSYESRVLYGIWAAAPYLHNGSVPTLADLLKPVAQRPATFKMGRNYDIQKVGIAATQDGNYTVTTTDCSALDSGNSRCGHTFGTEFTDAEKAALLEYLKML